jgi:ABC-type multidrug transport system fused ATPase/permease subunit
VTLKEMFLSITNRIIHILFSILILLTPLIFTANTTELFEFPKMFFVYLLGTTIIFVFLLQRVVIWQSIKFSNTAVLAFVGAYIVTSISSMHKFTSVWGYFTRWNGGLVSILVFFGMYLTLINTLNKKAFEKFTNLFLITLLPVSSMGLLSVNPEIVEDYLAEDSHREGEVSGLMDIRFVPETTADQECECVCECPVCN